MRPSILLVACLAVTPSAIAQTPSADEALTNFRAEVLHSRLFLRGSSADATTKYKWTSDGLVMAPLKLRTIGVFDLNVVKLHKQTVELTGKRSTLLKDKDGNAELLGEFPVKIEITLGDTDIAQVLPTLKEKLFYPSAKDALAAVPKSYADLLPGYAESLASLPHHGRLSPDEETLKFCSSSKAELAPPRAVHVENPALSQQAMQASFSGFVAVVLTVDESGHPTDLWLAKPTGMGLDEAAGDAVADYLFKPATCDGKPVSVPLEIEVGFNSFSR